MEEPPSDSAGLQPQDLSSACSLPNIFDLTRNAEECLLKANPIDALRVVQTPGWFVNPGTSNGMLLPETDSDPLPLPTDQIQPDNAFSNTTVTLSYVSRSHVFSEHSPIYDVPSLSKAFVLHPAAYDAGKLTRDAGDAALSVDQHCLQPVSVPVGLTACDQFGFMTPAQVVENMAAFCYLQQPPDVQDVESLALETLKSLQVDPSECRFPISMDELQIGAANGLWNVGPFVGGFPDNDGTNADGLHRNVNPELVFLISRSEEPVVLPNEPGAASFAISLNQDFISPLDPESPSAEQIEDVFALPRTASSPSKEVGDAKQEEQFDSMIAETESPETGKTDKTCNTESMHVSDASAEQTDTDAFKTTNDLSLSDSSVTTNKLERKILPPRARRGIRMGAIVQDIHPVRCKSSRVCKRKLQTSKSKKNVLERRRSVADEKKKKEETDVRRSSRRKAMLSTSSSAKAFVKRTKKKSSGRIRNLHSAQVNRQKPITTTSVKKSAKRRKNKHKVGHASFFSPQEPEIKLKCLKYKEEKNIVRDETFTPCVRVQIKAFPICTVISYPEDSVRSKQGKRRVCAGFASGVKPATPGLQYGRICEDGMQRDVLVCCLCGGSANAMDLGDLHGPYYPEGFKSASKAAPNPQEEDNSDSDSSFGEKCVASGSWTKSFWTSDSELSNSPLSKRPRTDGDTDWFSPPVVPLDANEHWLHEDCAIWSAGVFLVRGKLYGLENAVRLAKASVRFQIPRSFSAPQPAVMTPTRFFIQVCSTCQRRGATLGCVFKGCPNKYHYTCALQSGCVLNEDNFSMKCRKHKNKSIKGSSNRQISR
ncbi:uncharacterized protein LOC107742589 isoform X1 [Sinocyclocheilus rhinocerous]|uniref:uncharacterized protein LOC107742589 isoform X1 n=1 Tax=Sinocyclocheilus rhinocerous TaxID=307959 RepID=UPI0007B99F0B|nr:PREDICTED: uncharacterized protein LOC107742589 isoform X1 [Sinocyclocheilus rhinocerous]XP_016411117.1 PREDICTED: uncharacterized protein LOC107742589 isoform X1 [Sinocyclocheilus rhinocerous]